MPTSEMADQAPFLVPLPEVLAQLSTLAPRWFKPVATSNGRIRGEYKVFLPASAFQQPGMGFVPKALRWRSVYSAPLLRTGRSFGGAVHESRLQGALQGLCDERLWGWQVQNQPIVLDSQTAEGWPYQAVVVAGGRSYEVGAFTPAHALALAVLSAFKQA